MGSILPTLSTTFSTTTAEAPSAHFPTTVLSAAPQPTTTASATASTATTTILAASTARRILPVDNQRDAKGRRRCQHFR